jgi:hypothetical protein
VPTQLCAKPALSGFSPTGLILKTAAPIALSRVAAEATTDCPSWTNVCTRRKRTCGPKEEVLIYPISDI